jgi:putative endonuclease
MRGGWVYVMANRPFGSLYVGVTNDIARRCWEHRQGLSEGFTKRYRLTMLVYVEWQEDIRGAIQREKSRDRPGHDVSEGTRAIAVMAGPVPAIRSATVAGNGTAPHPFASSRTRGSSTV